MANQNMYSSAKLFVLDPVFVILGVAFATLIATFFVTNKYSVKTLLESKNN